MSRFNIKDIIRFLDGEMEEQEREIFQQELDTNEELKTELKLYTEVSSTLKLNLNPDKKDIAFKDNLKHYTGEYFNTKKQKTKIFVIQKYWYAAAILIVALMVWAPWNKNIYQQYAVTEMVSVAERGDNDQQLLSEATDEFNKRDFVKAKEKLKILVAQKPNDDMLKFYYGVSLLETNEIELARENFNEVYNGESIFKFDAAFYNALSYLKQNDKRAAKEWLNKVDKDADVYEKAQELLSKI